MDSKLLLASTAAGAGAAIAYYALTSAGKRGAVAPAGALAAEPFEPPAALAQSDSLVVSGTMLLCTQNLAVSGANQVLLNLVEGSIWRGNTVVLSPSGGPFAKEFADLGVAVQIGELDSLLKRIPDVRIAVCNTIMTAHLVVALGAAKIPQMWILHEWWPGEMLVEELAKRNDKNTTPELVREALAVCQRTVCVCRSQLELYRPAHGAVTFVGVPTPKADWQVATSGEAAKRPGTVTFLCLGIVCPRKNQHWAVEVFKAWAGSRQDVRLLVVGARYVRDFEIAYVEKVKSIIGGDARIELHDVTNDVDKYYRQSDALLFTSLNEVTPMVIAEAMMRGLPVVTTNIAGIPEMFTHGTHGFALPPDDPQPFVAALTELGATDANGQRRRLQMGAAARKHALETFTNASMVAAYRGAALSMAAPVVLIDMDGVLVDWDRGFAAAWGGRAPIERAKSYAMEECVPPAFADAATKLYHAEGFFRGLPPMAGGVAAVRGLAAKGYRVFLCTAPVLSSTCCAQEKFEWVRAHLGPQWCSRIILTSDKTAVRGDVLIDDKPAIRGAHHAVWTQLLFSAPYNASVPTRFRLPSWAQLDEALPRVLASAAPERVESVGHSLEAASAASAASLAGGVSKSAVAALPDFSHLLPPGYRKDYMAWRGGQAQGAKGELKEAMSRWEAMQDSVLNNLSEDFTEVHVFREGYAQWRRGRAAGARGGMPPLGKAAVSQL